MSGSSSTMRRHTRGTTPWAGVGATFGGGKGHATGESDRGLRPGHKSAARPASRKRESAGDGPCYGACRSIAESPVTSPLPPEVTATELPDGVRYRLPGRPWGQPALLGVGAVVGGLLGVTFLSFWLWGVGSPLLLQGWQPGDEILVVFLLLGAGMAAMLLRVAVRG